MHLSITLESTLHNPMGSTQLLLLAMSKLAIALVLLAASSAALQAHGSDPAPEALSLPRSDICDYTLEVLTGDVADAGTDAMLDFEVSDKGGTSSWSENIDGYLDDRFERNHKDYFTYRNQVCVDDPCILRITSDGSGNKPGWYCNYVKVTISGAISKSIIFNVYQWVYKDTMAYVDQCVAAASAS